MGEAVVDRKDDQSLKLRIGKLEQLDCIVGVDPVVHMGEHDALWIAGRPAGVTDIDCILLADRRLNITDQLRLLLKQGLAIGEHRLIGDIVDILLPAGLAYLALQPIILFVKVDEHDMVIEKRQCLDSITQRIGRDCQSYSLTVVDPESNFLGCQLDGQRNADHLCLDGTMLTGNPGALSFTENAHGLLSLEAMIEQVGSNIIGLSIGLLKRTGLPACFHSRIGVGPVPVFLSCIVQHLNNRSFHS